MNSRERKKRGRNRKWKSKKRERLREVAGESRIKQKLFRKKVEIYDKL